MKKLLLTLILASGAGIAQIAIVVPCPPPNSWMLCGPRGIPVGIAIGPPQPGPKGDKGDKGDPGTGGNGSGPVDWSLLDWTKVPTPPAGVFTDAIAAVLADSPAIVMSTAPPAAPGPCAGAGFTNGSEIVARDANFLYVCTQVDDKPTFRWRRVAFDSAWQ